MFPNYFGRNVAGVSTNKTLAAADSGNVQNVVADGVTVTLPAAAAGLSFTIRNGGAAPTGGAAGAASDQSVLVNITPNGTDTVTGLGFTPASGKGAQNVKANSRVGDEITLMGGSGTWYVAQSTGTWTRQP